MKMTIDNRNAGPVVLVGIDFSPIAGEVLRTAVGLAEGPKGELHLVHVRSRALSETTAILSADRPLDLASEADALHVRLELLAKEFAGKMARVVLHTRVGKPDVEIAQLAQDIGADIVVVGATGTKGIERLLLGSVAESLVRHAPCPVLACRPKAVPMWNQIEPPCPECIAVRKATGRQKFWCERHSEHHVRAHTYSEIPPGYGMGAQTFRES